MKIEKICLQCGKEFKTTEYKIKINKGKYCSVECYRISLIGKKLTKEQKMNIGLSNTGKKHPHTKETKLKIRKARKGKIGNNKGKHWKIKDTSNMNKDKIGKPSPMKGKNLSKETREKIGNSLRGEKSPLYIKDRTKLKKSEKKHLDTKYKYWMLEVKKRDNWICKLSDSECNGRIEAHHILNWIDYPEERYNINNGITLCQFHHPKKWTEEKRLITIFKELVSVSKE